MTETALHTAPDEAPGGAARPRTGGTFVVEALKAAGVRTVYGVPGGQTLAILDAIYDDPELTFVATRHEMAAAHAAEAHYRMTGTPGVCLVTTGPGATHAASALGGALRDRIGMVFLTCNNRREYLGEEDAQAADHMAILRPLVKWSGQVAHERALLRTLRTALGKAAESPAGSVHVDLPRDILEATVDLDLADVRPPLVHGPLPPDPAALADAVERLRAARRPVLWVGNGITHAGAQQAVLRLAEQLGAPIITTFSGIGAVPADHPLVFGPRTRHGTRVSHAVLDQADVLLAIGMRLSSSSTHRWTAALPSEVIHSDVDPDAIGRHYRPDVSVVGDALAVTTGLVEQLADADAGRTADWRVSLDQAREEWHADLAAVPMENAEGLLHPAALMKIVAAVSPRDTVFSVDAGNPGIWSHLLPVYEPRSYMKPVNFGQMGFALPAAIAAKRARPDRPVVVLIGDGSLGMTVSELETAVRERLAITVVVLNDSAYNNIRQEQLALLDGPRYIGVDFGNVDFATVARGFGAHGQTARGAADTEAALRTALAREGPAVVDVKIDPMPNVWLKPF
ncbi:thiamine pyrophosphate-binding protein [Amycolatopsis sp. NPDC051372]|uniref:thiamine pyrophosphate-binding protein n=1 Tax=Amycolatopsis sp. NPDC051372 TaxID=3155669 RepID=UPI0034148C51